jgi:hypothetical protein
MINPEKVGQFLGKDTKSVKSAIAKGSEILPQLQSATDGGVGILKKYGVSSDFIRGMNKKYGRYARRFGVSLDGLDDVCDSLDKGSKPIREPQQGNRAERRAAAKYDRAKYRRV